MLLLWKSTLLIFGGSKELKKCKSSLSEETETDKDGEDAPLTASPLDYHVFRQEITSKYPAYNPPPPLVPLEPNNSSMLPPLSNHPSRSASHDGLQGLGGLDGSKSIFHQSVHIATPAPSPPPSPAGPGGKGGKKQNYQTNQMFPFLYPPLDSTSNEIGGKGRAGQQGKLVGRTWEGSDVPASILEAGELFAGRMRMSRPLRQLWEVREEFVKFERGWKEDGEREDRNDGLEERLSNLQLEDSGGSKARKAKQKSKQARQKEEKETDDEFVQSRLDAVETYFVRLSLFSPISANSYSEIHFLNCNRSSSFYSRFSWLMSPCSVV